MANCNVPGCKTDVVNMGLCGPHLLAYRKGDASLRQYLQPGSPEGAAEEKKHIEEKPAASSKKTPPDPKTCRVPRCGEVVACRGICKRHYAAIQSRNDVGDEARKALLPSKTCPAAREKTPPPNETPTDGGVSLLVAFLRKSAPGLVIVRDNVEDFIIVFDKITGKGCTIKQASSIRVTSFGD